MCSPGSEEGPVSALAQRASNREQGVWQRLSGVALLDFLGLHYAFMFSLRCYVLSPGQLGHIFNGPFG